MAETIRKRVVRLIAEMRNRTTERGATPAEAAGFAAKIAEWIEKYQIEEAELRASKSADGNSVDAVEVCENYLRTGKKVFNSGMSQVVHALAHGMCCKVILLHKRNVQAAGEAVYGITGDSVDADYVCQVATAVIPALQMMGNLEGREHGYEKAGLVRWTNQYLTGAATEIKKRLEDDRKIRAEIKRIEHQFGQGNGQGGGGALVCITGESIAVIKKRATEEAFKKRYPKTQTQWSRSSYDGTANAAGREAGKRVGLNPTIGN